VAVEISALADAFHSRQTVVLAIAVAERRLHESRIEDRVTMSVGLWVILAIGAFLALSLPVGLALGAILGRMSEELSYAFETELWASAPPRLSLRSTEEVAVEQEAVDSEHHGAPRIPALVK
jgi:hypothetical protein